MAGCGLCNAWSDRDSGVGLSLGRGRCFCGTGLNVFWACSCDAIRL